jgi:hypothetical protein
MKAIVLTLLRAYKRFLSPALLPACRFVPSCSEYAVEAIERRGLFMGALLALYRLLRCNPCAHGGYDPVPENQFPVSGFQYPEQRRANDSPGNWKPETGNC